MECGGYGARIYSHTAPFSVSGFVAQYFLIVVVSLSASMLRREIVLSLLIVLGTRTILGSHLSIPADGNQ